MNRGERLSLRLLEQVDTELALVDAQEEVPRTPTPDHEGDQSAEVDARMADAIASMTLSPANLRRVGAVRSSFDAVDDGAAGERLLEQLIAGEVGIGHELQDLEANCVSLLRKAVGNPAVALEVAKVTREVVALSSAVRRRTENSLGTVSTLRTQRLLLTAQRGRFGG